ncbi:MAG: hypothetical protein NC453_20010 [Muribaculum sp.]|nr:hypothetical protein [Muribaculum sp.]
MSINHNSEDLSENKVKLMIYIIVGLGITILSILILVLWHDGFTFWSGITDYVTTSYVGAFIGGTLGALFAFLNAYLLYKTLKTQSIFNKYAVHNNTKESFISQYYELLHIHDEIVNQFSIEQDKGRQVFKTLHDEFRLIFECVENYLAEISKWDSAKLVDGSDDRKIYDFVNSIDTQDYKL